MVVVSYHVYILASRPNGTLYVGMTSNLAKRVWQHKNDVAEGFKRKHGVKTLVHIECYADLTSARSREYTLKRWRRSWKLDLIESHNPTWRDLFDDLNL